MNILPGAAWLITARVSRRFFRLQTYKHQETVLTKEILRRQ